MARDLIRDNAKTLEVVSEGRAFKRFANEGAVSMTFGGRTATGNIVNLSVSGLLANFSSNAPLPNLSENVEMRLEAASKENVLDLKGMVVRVQPPKDYERQDLIEIAVNFGEIEPSVKYGLERLIKYLQVTTTSYKV